VLLLAQHSCGVDGAAPSRQAGAAMSASRRKGTSWESAVVAYLIEQGWPHAERRALHGALDKGDVTGLPGVCLELKNAARVELAAWWEEAKAERRNANAATAAVWFKRKGKASPRDGYVLMDGETYTDLLKAAGW
jgi:hypothetical protein